MIVVSEKKNMDERQEVINKNMLIRAFGFLSILLIVYIVTLGFIHISTVGHQLMLIGILTLTSVYMWIDSFINKILYFDVQNNKGLKKKVSSCITTLLIIDIAIIILSLWGKIDLNISLLFLVTLLAINIIIISIYAVILKLWLIWYR